MEEQIVKHISEEYAKSLWWVIFNPFIARDCRTEAIQDYIWQPLSIEIIEEAKNNFDRYDRKMEIFKLLDEFIKIVDENNIKEIYFCKKPDLDWKIMLFY